LINAIVNAVCAKRLSYTQQGGYISIDATELYSFIRHYYGMPQKGVVGDVSICKDESGKEAVVPPSMPTANSPTSGTGGGASAPEEGGSAASKDVQLDMVRPAPTNFNLAESLNRGNAFPLTKTDLTDEMPPGSLADSVIGLLGPVADINWVGKWRIKKVLDKARKLEPEAGELCNGERLLAWLDDPKRKPAHRSFTDGFERQIAYRFEACQRSGYSVDTTKPRVVVEKMESIPSEISDYELIVKMTLSMGDGESSYCHLESLAAKALSAVRPYLRTKEPVSIEHCARSVYLYDPEHESSADYRRDIAQAVLDAAGVKYVD
jgi:hypothetical protein